MLSQVGALESGELLSVKNSHYMEGFPSFLTFKVGHISVHIGVESVDHHLPVSRAGDFHPAVNETGCGGSSLPCAVLTDVLRLWQEVGQDTTVKLGLSQLAALKKGLAGAIEGAVQECQKGQGLGCQNLAVRIVDLAEDGDTIENCVCGSHYGSCDEMWRKAQRGGNKADTDGEMRTR